MADSEFRHKLKIRCGECHHRLVLIATAERAVYRCETCGTDDVVNATIDWADPTDSVGGDE